MAIKKVESTGKMNASRLSDDDIQDMFTESYEKNVASINSISSFECICKRDTSSGIKMEVTVYGMSGSPSLIDYKSGKVKNSGSVIISREGNGSLKFNAIPSEMLSLNTNDYLVVYKAV